MTNSPCDDFAPADFTFDFITPPAQQSEDQSGSVLEYIQAAQDRMAEAMGAFPAYAEPRDGSTARVLRELATAHQRKTCFWANLLDRHLLDRHLSIFVEDRGDWVQTRFPRSKKRRIRKKWARRTPRNLQRYFRFEPWIANQLAIKMDNGGFSSLWMNRLTLEQVKAAIGGERHQHLTFADLTNRHG